MLSIAAFSLAAPATTAEVTVAKFAPRAFVTKTLDTSVELIENFANPTHYGNPDGGCESDEIAVAGPQIGLTGSFCSPPCNPDGSCPTDFPTGVTALAQCALTYGSDKYCMLECLSDAMCDTGATCKGATPTQYGICTYDSAPPPPGPTTHYEDPFDGCQADEITIGIQGMDGQICAPKCNPDSSCPTDVPAGTTAVPQCVLQSSAGMYCALECLPTMDCPDKATCKGSSPSQFGICTYDSR